jgi:hypothetical protein
MPSYNALGGSFEGFENSDFEKPDSDPEFKSITLLGTAKKPTPHHSLPAQEVPWKHHPAVFFAPMHTRRENTRNPQTVNRKPLRQRGPPPYTFFVYSGYSCQEGGFNFDVPLTVPKAKFD